MRRPAWPAMVLALSLGSAMPAAAQQPGIQRTQQGVNLNFQDVDLAYVISALAQLASLNVVYYDLPDKQVTVRTSRPVSLDEIAGLIRNLAISNGVSVDEAGGFMRLQGALSQDQQPPRQLYIERLRHARAPVLAETLTTLFGGVIRTSNPARAAASLSAQLRALEQQQQLAQQGIEIGVPRIVGELEGNVTIVPDELTNSLLVRATPADWQIIQQAIQALDLRPLQVVIEVLIAEVRRTDELDVGTSFLIESESGRTGAMLPDPGAAPGDFSAGIVRSGVVNLEATLSALASTGNVRIISRPIVMAQNNQEAQIFVGSERPFVAFSQAVPNDQGILNQSIQYRDVGTNLTITPTINEDGYVNLAVLQEVNAATSELQFDAPVISTRTAQTQLLARNGQTVVVGGLVDRQEDHTRTGIPFLKDIPILGYLFGRTRSITGTSELFLFLTPYIVASDEDADRVRDEIEERAELLRTIIPIEPLLPRVVRIIPDTSGVSR
ncbi:MAG: hypothetical protein L0271_03370 [Gemmatimonadetes bacterium]|nr:hypothetical protein [Gemmatimonadota bacterium]